jgi:anaerobic ribonucleoside-triphosphate reductase activating protein
VLVDGKFQKDKINSKLRFRGSSNQRIINVKESLDALGAVAIDFDKKV